MWILLTDKQARRKKAFNKQSPNQDPLCLAERTVWTGLRERKESQARVGAFVIGFCAEYDSMLCSEGITDHFMARRRHG